MGWPKKDTRRFHLDDREFLWHLSGNHLDSKVRITVGTRGGKYVLFIDPYAHDFDITPSTVKRAMQWALDQGWSPETGPTQSMGYSAEQNQFLWLPEGSRFEHQCKSENQAT